MELKIKPAPWDSNKFMVKFYFPKYMDHDAMLAKCRELGGDLGTSFFLSKEATKSLYFTNAMVFNSYAGAEAFVDWANGIEVMHRLANGQR